jgi:hypothetical protein
VAASLLSGEIDGINKINKNKKSNKKVKFKFKIKYKGGTTPHAPTKKLNKKPFNFLFSATPRAGTPRNAPLH